MNRTTLSTKSTKLIFFLFIFNTITHCIAFGQEYSEIIYSEYAPQSEVLAKRINLAPKSDRVDNRAGIIHIQNAPELDSDIYKVVDYAASIWEASILNGVNIYIKILVQDLDCDIKTSVRYEVVDNILYPVSLKYYLNKMYIHDNTYPDGTIIINKSTKWDYGFSESSNPEFKNLTYSILRSMARILGFGANVSINEKGEYSFSDKRYHTIFNSKIYDSDNIPLTSININKGLTNLDLKNYVEDPNQTFKINGQSSSYVMENGPFSYSKLPFLYLHNSGGLMDSNTINNEYSLKVDNATVDILKGLGWGIKTTPNVNIISENLPQTGLTSIYKPIEFKIEADDISGIINPQWILRIPLLNGEIENIRIKDNNLSCTIKLNDWQDRYIVNCDGDIEAQLIFKCETGGTELQALPIKIYFELKPVIEYSKITKIEDHENEPFYDVNYEIRTLGADRIYVSYEIENNPMITNWIFNSQDFIENKINNIFSLSFAWIYFEAENIYGKEKSTIELKPRNYESSASVNSVLIKPLEEIEKHGLFEVYNTNGIKVGEYFSIDEIKKKGIFIVKYSKNNNQLYFRRIKL